MFKIILNQSLISIKNENYLFYSCNRFSNLMDVDSWCVLNKIDVSTSKSAHLFKIENNNDFFFCINREKKWIVYILLFWMLNNQNKQLLKCTDIQAHANYKTCMQLYSDNLRLLGCTFHRLFFWLFEVVMASHWITKINFLLSFITMFIRKEICKTI